MGLLQAIRRETLKRVDAIHGRQTAGSRQKTLNLVDEDVGRRETAAVDGAGAD